MRSGTDKPKRAQNHSSTIRSIGDPKRDPKNARKHGERNIGMLERSLEQFGAARSIVVDEEGQIIAGHGVVEAAASVGIEKVRPVEADGNEIIAVVRRGLTKRQKAELAIADNRTQELSEWAAGMLKESDPDLEKFFTRGELEALEDREAKVKEWEIKPPPDPVGAFRDSSIRSAKFRNT